MESWTDPTISHQAPGVTLAMQSLQRQLWNMGWGRMGYAVKTSNQTGITTIADLTSLTVDVTVAEEGRTLKVTGFGNFSSSAASHNFYVREGSTKLATTQRDVTNGNPYFAVVMAVIENPTVGVHTYKLSFSSSSSATLNASTTEPGLILVEDVGPVTPL